MQLLYNFLLLNSNIQMIKMYIRFNSFNIALLKITQGAYLFDNYQDEYITLLVYYMKVLVL